MPDLSSLARTVLQAVTSVPGGPPEFDVNLVRTVLDVNEPTANSVLDELAQSGTVVERQAISNNGSWYRIVDAETIALDHERPDVLAVETAIMWTVGQTMAANHARDRNSRTVGHLDGPAATSRFDTPADAMVWFNPLRAGLLDLVDALFDRQAYERCIALAEAVFGLAGHGGYPQDQLQVVRKGLEANARWFYGPGYVAGRHKAERRTRFCEIATKLNLMLAEVESRLHGPVGALRAIEDAEERAREIGDERALAAVHRRRAITHHAADNLTDAETSVRLALELDKASGDGRRMYLSWRRLGNIKTSQGLYVEADAAFAKAAQGAHDLGHDIARARVLIDWSAADTAAGKAKAAESKLAVALVALKREEAGSDLYIAEALRNRAFARRVLNDAAGADQDFRQAVERFRLAHHERAAEALEKAWHQPR